MILNSDYSHFLVQLQCRIKMFGEVRRSCRWNLERFRFANLILSEKCRCVPSTRSQSRLYNVSQNSPAKTERSFQHEIYL
jgi:hypothetical protein